MAFTKVAKSEPGTLSVFRKENVHYLCCSATTKRPVKVYISRYRRPDKGEGYEERRKWSLEELKKVDGHDLSPSCLNFDLHFDRPFRFEATAHGDKEDFLEGIAQACGKYHGAQPPPVFENVSSKVKKNLPTASDLRSQMASNQREVAERGHKISELESRTADMAETAKSFSETARDLANHYRK